MDLHDDESAKDMTKTSDYVIFLAEKGLELTHRTSLLDAALSKGDPKAIAFYQTMLAQTISAIDFWWSELEKRLGAQPSDAGAPDEI